MPGKPSPLSGAFDRRTTIYLSILERKIRDNEYVDGAELAEIFAGHSGNGPPDAVSDYLCRFLRGEIQKPRGRKRVSGDLMREAILILAKAEYESILRWLQKRKRRYGHLTGWCGLKKAEWWDRSPNEIAIHMVSEGFAKQLNIDERHLRNLISEK